MLVLDPNVIATTNLSKRPEPYSKLSRPRELPVGLTALVKQALGEDPLSGDLFVFIGGSGKLVKTLLWDRTGFIIIAKRLEKGTFRLRNQADKLVIILQSLELLLDGIPASGDTAGRPEVTTPVIQILAYPAPASSTSRKRSGPAS